MYEIICIIEISVSTPSSAASSTYTLLTNPTTHYYGGDPAVITNNPNIWIPYSSNIPKSIYDPCPYGYRVPKDGSWNGFPSKSWTRYTVNEGIVWNSSWWPAAGYREASSTVLDNIGSHGIYWSSSQYSIVYRAYNSYFDYYGNATNSNYGNRSTGFPVRCIEKAPNS